MEAVRRLRAGESAASVAASLGVGSNSVYTWGKTARVRGTRALRAVPKSGRHPKLPKEDRPRLRRMILAGPRACGFSTDLWTLPLIGRLIRKEFGVEYHEDHLSRFVRGLGMSHQKPAVRARERDEKAIRRFVEVEFPAIEKKPDAAAPR